MASVVITLKIMPDSPERDLDVLTPEIKKTITEFTGDEQFKEEKEPIGFGLVALKLTFVMDEAKGDTETVEKKIADMEGVESVDVVDVRRTIG